MPRYEGNYGKVSIGSDETAEMGAWWVELTGGGLRLKSWEGSFEVSAVERIALAEPLTLQLFSGDDDSESMYVTGQAIVRRLPLIPSSSGTITVSFQGTGVLELVNGDERQVL
jgi:hypothetical protein